MRDGYITDFISGLEVKATPEEVEAVQVFSKILVEDYGYPKDFIMTHPQYRVKVRPSDEKKEYPIDIGVFLIRQRTKTAFKSLSNVRRKTGETEEAS